MKNLGIKEIELISKLERIKKKNPSLLKAIKEIVIGLDKASKQSKSSTECILYLLKVQEGLLGQNKGLKEC